MKAMSLVLKITCETAHVKDGTVVIQPVRVCGTCLFVIQFSIPHLIVRVQERYYYYADNYFRTENEDQENNIILIIVVVTVGGSAVLMALIVCVVLVWCCVVKTSPKANHLKRSRKNNYKGNVSYVLPYTIYGKNHSKWTVLVCYTLFILANRSSALEPLDSQNRHSDLFGEFFLKTT
jgi:hypothetical protein